MAVTNEIIERRVAKVRQRMRDRDLGALVVYAAPTDLGLSTLTAGNIRYLCNWADKFQPSLMVLPLDADPVLLVYATLNKHWARELNMWVHDIRTEEDSSVYGTVAREILNERGIPPGGVGVVGRVEMPEPGFKGLTSGPSPWEFVDADDIINEERVIKEPAEIELHRMAAKISDSMLYAVMNGAREPGKQAWQLMVDMEYEGRSLAAEYASGWLATGPEPDFITIKLSHNMRQLQGGDRIQAGTYVVYDGYWGHGLGMGIKGKASPELKHYFDAILEVQNAGIRRLKPGARLRDAVNAMEAAIDEYCPLTWEEDPLRFHPGHGLGLSYYDPLVTDAFPQSAHFSDSGRTDRGGTWRGQKATDLKVQAGMVIELHPNFSVPGLGIICIGDVVLVTESGVELLTKFPRELFEI